MIRLYFGKRVEWRSPVTQDQFYYGVELHRLFIGLVLTATPPQEGTTDDR